MKSLRGFTIVELLIVIVVIAILAAISVVAYNSIQSRAETSKTITAVNDYRKALMNYAAVNGSFLPSTFCLGEDYPIITGTTAGCRISTSPIAQASGATDRNALKTFMGVSSLPMPSTRKFVQTDGADRVGAYYYGTSAGFTLNGDPVVLIEYNVDESTCPVGPVYSGSGNPNFSGNPVPRTSAINGTKGSVCYLFISSKV